MGLRFYFGASGAGKSKKLHEDIVRRSMEEPDTNFLVIVPDQFTMQTQMDLVLAHPRKGIMNIDVLSFGRLSHRIMEEVGAEPESVLDDTGKSLILRKVAEEAGERMPVIGSNLHKMGYIHEVKSAISEFMQYGIGKKELGELTEYARTRGALYRKLKDMEVLYDGFLTYIHGKYITTEETLDLLCQALPKSKLIPDSVVAFDGFTGFTPVQNKVIQQLMVLTKEVIVTVTMDDRENPYVVDGEQNLFYLSKKTTADIARLAEEAGIRRESDIFLKERRLNRFKDNAEMQHLERNLFRYPAQVYEAPCRSIHLFEATTPAEEVRQVCIRMKELIRNGHGCYRDFAVVTGNLEVYAEHMEAEAAKFGIPVFMDRTRGILLNPFTEYIRSALKIVADNFSYRSVFHYLRSGLADFNREDVDCLENYVLSAGIRGKKRWSELFTARKKGTDMQEELARLNGMREKLMEQLAPLMERVETVGERIRALYLFITQNRVQEKLSGYETMFRRRNEAARAKEYGQIYRLVMDLLDQIDALLSEEKMGKKEFLNILDAGFGEIQVGTIPQDVDRVVVGDIERTRLREIKTLFFVGVNDGNIPKKTGTGGIISDIDREFLQQSPYSLAPTPRQQMYIQRLYLYMNMTKPSGELYLSFCKVDSEGKTVRPAYLADTICRLFPALKTQAPELVPKEEQIVGKKDGLYCFADMLREYASESLSAAERTKFMTLYHIYREDTEYGEEINRLIDAAFTFYREKPLGKKVAQALYGKLLIGSVSRLEKYAACAYAHFLQYGLSLKEREEYGFEAVDMGNVFHGVLELFAGKLREADRTWFDFGEEEAGVWLEEALNAYTASYGDTVLYSTARNEYAINRMHRILKRTVLTLQHQLQKGSFLPEDFEFSFTVADSPETLDLTLSEDEKLKIRGRIDRMDTYVEGDKVYVKIIDYKSGSKKFDLAALYYGLQLQLVVYMNAAVELEKQKYPDKEVIPAALLYYHVSDPMIKTEQEIPPEEISRRLFEELRTTGIVNESDTVISLLDGAFEGKSDAVPVERKKDGSYSAKSSVINTDDLREISEYVNHKVRQIGKEILEGNIAVNPCTSACEYCAYHAVCGYDEGMKGYTKRELKDMEEEEVLKRIREENGKARK